MQAMIDGLRENLPRRGVSWTEPQGGYTLWLQVSGTKLAEQALHDRLLAAGVRLSSGRLFHAHAPAIPASGSRSLLARPTRSARAAGASAACCARRSRADMLLSPKSIDRLRTGPIAPAGPIAGHQPVAARAARRAASTASTASTASRRPIALAGPAPRASSRHRARSSRPSRRRSPCGAPEPPAWLTFSGNGEPTLHPAFPEIVDRIISLRDRALPQARTAILSNSSRLEQVRDPPRPVASRRSHHEAGRRNRGRPAPVQPGRRRPARWSRSSAVSRGSAA